MRVKGCSERSRCSHAECETGDAGGAATAQTCERTGYGIVRLQFNENFIVKAGVFLYN